MQIVDVEGCKKDLAENLFSPLNGMTLLQWGKFLYLYGGHIQPRYIPRTLFGSMMSVLNSLFASMEAVAYRDQMAKAVVKAPIFVLGHHRSGTTHLWNLLSCDPQFAYPSVLQAVFPSSFLLFERLVRGLAFQLTVQKRPQDNVEMDPDSPIEEERALCAKTLLSLQLVRHFPRKWETFTSYLTMEDATFQARETWKKAFQGFAKKLLIRHGGHKRLLFKSPEHTGKIRLLREAFPDARFIHIHRDPLRVFASTCQMEERTHGIYAFQSWKSAQDREAFILWRYRAMYDAFVKEASSLRPHQLVEVSYEEVDKKPIETLHRVYRQLELSRSEEADQNLRSYVNRLSGYRKNTYSALNESVQGRVIRAWSPYFKRWGYINDRTV